MPFKAPSDREREKDYNYTTQQQQHQRKLFDRKKNLFSALFLSSVFGREKLNGNKFKWENVFAGNIFKCERFCGAIIIKCRHAIVVSLSLSLFSQEDMKLIVKYVHCEMLNQKTVV